MGFLKELKERNVVKVGAIYAITGWVVIQIASIAFPTFAAPDWVLRVFIFVVLLGFPLALVMAWALELTPEGIKRAESSVGEKRMWTIAISLALLTIAWFEFGAPAVRTTDVVATAEKVEAEEQGVSIAVLPFLDLSADEDQGYFALGMSEELLNVLAQIDGLAVASRTSAFAFQGSELGVVEIADKLGVNHILEGSIRKAGDQLRITAQLIDTRTDRHLWSETFDRELKDVFVIQDEIATAIVEALREPLGIVDAGSAVTLPASTDNLDAYTLYLEGRELFFLRHVAPAVEKLERMAALDPNFARGLGLLSAVYTVAPSWIGEDRPYIQLSKDTAERAIALDPELALPHAVLGFAYFSTKPINIAVAEEYLLRAITLDPRDATPLSWLALLYNYSGFTDKAEAMFKECLRVEPGYFNCRRNLAANYMMHGEYETGARLFESAISQLPWVNDPNASILFGLRAAGRETEFQLMGNYDLVTIGAHQAGWIDLLENPPPALPEKRARFRTALKEVVDAERGTWSHVNLANTMLAAIGHPEDIRLNEMEWYWAFLLQPAYRESERRFTDLEELGLIDYFDKVGPPPRCKRVAPRRYDCALN